MSNGTYTVDKSYSNPTLVSARLLVLCNELLQPLLIGTLHLINLHSTLEELKRGHRLDATGRRHLFCLIDIAFDKDCVRIRFRQLFKNGTNELARSAPVATRQTTASVRSAFSRQDSGETNQRMRLPSGRKVNNHKLALALLHQSLELLHCFNKLDHCDVVSLCCNVLVV